MTTSKPRDAAGQIQRLQLLLNPPAAFPMVVVASTSISGRKNTYATVGEPLLLAELSELSFGPCLLSLSLDDLRRLKSSSYPLPPNPIPCALFFYITFTLYDT
jgi:hypothetical protein